MVQFDFLRVHDNYNNAHIHCSFADSEQRSQCAYQKDAKQGVPVDAVLDEGRGRL